jgi:hypothetical protein
LADTVLALPTGLQLDERGVTRITEILSDAIANADAIRSRLGRRQAA